MSPSILLPLALTTMAIGLLIWQWGRGERKASGLPAGTVVYNDTSTWQVQEKPLISRRYGLVGRPDYLVETPVGGRIITIPVEVKSRKQPRNPYHSHILQLATYCILVEEKTKITPPYGLLRYADNTIEIPFTDDLRQQVLTISDEIRAARQAADLSRNHDEAARCRNCGYLEACGDGAAIASGSNSGDFSNTSRTPISRS